MNMLRYETFPMFSAVYSVCSYKNRNKTKQQQKITILNEEPLDGDNNMDYERIAFVLLLKTYILSDCMSIHVVVKSSQCYQDLKQ